MKAIRRINNNVIICLDDNNNEVIARGKGIGFHDFPYEADLNTIERTYYNIDSSYYEMIKEIPDEIIESARMDNAGEWKIMTRIMLPMCTPTMVTIAMFSFIGTWNSYFWPLVMTFDDKYRPLTIMIERLKDMDSGIDYNLIMAGNCVLVVPVLIVFFFASKKIIQSYAYRGMK